MTFKEAINTYGKEITASISCGGVTYSDRQIASMNPHFEGALLRSVMRCMDLELDGVESVSGDTITDVKFGVRVPGGTYQYKQYGTYLVKDAPQYDDEKKSLSLVCYDLMLRSMVPYDLHLDYSGGKITVAVLLDAICTRLGWVKGYTTFVNSSVVIDNEKYDNQYTFRDVLDEIAQVAAGTIAFVGDKLCVLYPRDSGEEIDPSNLKKLKIGAKYGPINSVVLGRSPQEDNIYRKDSDSVAENGLTEFRIDNNQLMDSHRGDFIQGIFNQLSGLEFYLYELESFGIGYLDLCDMFTFAALDGSSYSTIMFSDDLEITQGVNETSELTAPNETKTDYSAASESDRVINQTVLRVDKQSQQISSLVTTTKDTSTKLKDTNDRITTVQNLTNSTIDQRSESIRTEVKNNYYLKGETDDLISSASTQMNQTASSLQIDFNKLQKNVDGVAENAESGFEEIHKYIRFEDGNIIQGAAGSPFKKIQTPTKESYYDGGKEIAYFSNQKLYVTDGEFLHGLKVGYFEWVPRSNGNLALRKVVGT